MAWEVAWGAPEVEWGLPREVAWGAAREVAWGAARGASELAGMAREAAAAVGEAVEVMAGEEKGIRGTPEGMGLAVTEAKREVTGVAAEAATVDK